jgi:hypothetical protein
LLVYGRTVYSDGASFNTLSGESDATLSAMFSKASALGKSLNDVIEK